MSKPDTKARALAERIRIDCCWLDHTREGGPGIDFDAEAAAELLEQYAADAREQERQACIAYADRTERMFLARAQSVADDSDRADSEAASDDEERHEMRAEGARAVAHGLRKAAHRQPKEEARRDAEHGSMRGALPAEPIPMVHDWVAHEREGWTVCSRCGMVRNYRDEIPACSGALPKVRPRAEQPEPAEQQAETLARAWEEGAEAAFDAEYSGPLYGPALDEFYASNPYRRAKKGGGDR